MVPALGQGDHCSELLSMEKLTLVLLAIVTVWFTKLNVNNLQRSLNVYTINIVAFFCIGNLHINCITLK